MCVFGIFYLKLSTISPDFVAKIKIECPDIKILDPVSIAGEML